MTTPDGCSFPRAYLVSFLSTIVVLEAMILTTTSTNRAGNKIFGQNNQHALEHAKRPRWVKSPAIRYVTPCSRDNCLHLDFGRINLRAFTMPSSRRKLSLTFEVPWPSAVRAGQYIRR
jgi:hypothetical protein